MRDRRGISNLNASLLLAVLYAGSPPRTSLLEGVWRRVAERYTAPDTSWTITQPQPSLYIFTPRYYSMMYVVGTQARRFSGPEPTSAEKVAAYDIFRASAGTYALQGHLLIVHPIVARSPDYMSAQADTAWFQLRGDTLYLTARYQWWRNRGQMVEDRVTLVRVR
jgi:hypothetical protein